MDTVLFCAALGGATLIIIICGVRLMRKFPRIPQRRPIEEEDPNLYAVAMRTWETGRATIGTVDEHGTLTMGDAVSQPTDKDMKG